MGFAYVNASPDVMGVFYEVIPEAHAQNREKPPIRVKKGGTGCIKNKNNRL